MPHADGVDRAARPVRFPAGAQLVEDDVVEAGPLHVLEYLASFTAQGCGASGRAEHVDEGLQGFLRARKVEFTQPVGGRADDPGVLMAGEIVQQFLLRHCQISVGRCRVRPRSGEELLDGFAGAGSGAVPGDAGQACVERLARGGQL